MADPGCGRPPVWTVCGPRERCDSQPGRRARWRRGQAKGRACGLTITGGPEWGLPCWSAGTLIQAARRLDAGRRSRALSRARLLAGLMHS